MATNMGVSHKSRFTAAEALQYFLATQVVEWTPHRLHHRLIFLHLWSSLSEKTIMGSCVLYTVTIFHFGEIFPTPCGLPQNSIATFKRCHMTQKSLYS